MLLVALLPSAALADTAFTGPVNASEATYYGADETGSYDGIAAISNADDFTARAIPLNDPNPAPANLGTVPGSWSGNTFTVATAPVVDVPNMAYYRNTGPRRAVSIAVSAPAGWTAQICRDAGGGATHVTTTATSADCTGVSTSCESYPSWSRVGGVTTANLCVDHNKTVVTVYWVRYTGPTTLTAFARYDASITESLNASNTTHDELYAGFLPLTKQVAVASSGCPAGAHPTYPALGVCPGGVLRYTIDYRNIVAGGGMGTQGANTGAFPITAAGSLVLTDDGTLSTASQTGIPNWATFSAGFYAPLQAGLGTMGNTGCGLPSNACGDSTAGTTFSYAMGIPRGTYSAAYSAAATAFQATVGGAGGQLYPVGMARTSQGTLTFAVTVK
jgi:hypothetical protein